MPYVVFNPLRGRGRTTLERGQCRITPYGVVTLRVDDLEAIGISDRVVVLADHEKACLAFCAPASEDEYTYIVERSNNRGPDTARVRVDAALAYLGRRTKDNGVYATAIVTDGDDRPCIEIRLNDGPIAVSHRWRMTP